MSFEQYNQIGRILAGFIKEYATFDRCSKYDKSQLLASVANAFANFNDYIFISLPETCDDPTIKYSCQFYFGNVKRQDVGCRRKGKDLFRDCDSDNEICISKQKKTSGRSCGSAGSQHQAN